MIYLRFLVITEVSSLICIFCLLKSFVCLSVFTSGGHTDRHSHAPTHTHTHKCRLYLCNGKAELVFTVTRELCCCEFCRRLRAYIVSTKCPANAKAAHTHTQTRAQYQTNTDTHTYINSRGLCNIFTQPVERTRQQLLTSNMLPQEYL